MGIISDPTGSIYTTKANWDERPSIIPENQWFGQSEANQIRSALVELGQSVGSNPFLWLSGSVFLSQSMTGSNMFMSGTVTALSGVVVASPNGSLWRITVTDAGALSSTLV